MITGKSDLKMPIRLVGLDLDGTTFDNSSHLAPETKLTLKDAVSRGVHIVVATGRPFSAIPDEVKNFEGIEYIISANGAAITYLPENKVVFHSCIDEASVRTIAEILRKEPYLVEVITAGEAFIQRDCYENIFNYGLSDGRAVYLRETRKPVDNIYDFMLEHKEHIEDVIINFASTSERQRLWDVFENLGTVMVTASSTKNIELGGLTTSKANGLAELGKLLGITLAEMMACGDSPNDAAMLRECGLAVAMGNADPEVKAIADFITLTNQECGVAHAIKLFT